MFSLFNKFKCFFIKLKLYNNMIRALEKDINQNI